MRANLKASWKSLDAGVRKHLLQIEGPTIQRAVLQDARELQARVLARTPVGKTTPKKRGQVEGYGPLAMAIVAWPFKRKIPDRVSAFVAVDRKIAWYGRMVEFGHRIGTRETGYLQKMNKKGFYSGAGYKGTMFQRLFNINPFKWVPAHPFFGPAKKGFQMKHLLKELRRIIRQTNFESGYYHHEGM